jgi:NADPH2:quinone reductase
LNATFPLAEVPRAHAMLDANEQIGKVVLTVDPELAGVIPHLRAA